MSTLIDDLAAILGDGLLLTEAERRARARDTWMRSQIAVSAGSPVTAPLAVCAPSSSEELAETVRACLTHRTPMIPRGGGSGVVGGVLADAGSVVLSTERMAGLRAFSSTDLLATFGAGTNGLGAEQRMQAEGLTIGHWPQSIELSTVGGWVATRASGQFSTLYGNIEDMVYSLEAVLADGSVYRSRATPRAGAGPDLRHLLMGSEGTLGVVTEVTLSVRAQPDSEVRQAFHFDHFDAGLEAVRRFMRSGWRPAVVRLYDGRESQRHFPERLPEGRAMLILAHLGPAPITAAAATAVSGICESVGGRRAPNDVVDAWFEHRNTVPTWEELLGRGIVADTIEIAGHWTRLAALYHTVIEALEAVEGVVAASCHSSHAYRSGANLYFTVAAAPGAPDDYASTYDAMWSAAMNAAAGAGAGLAHHHGIGRVRRDWLGIELGDAGVSLLRALKQAVDPLSLMNPGVLVP